MLYVRAMMQNQYTSLGGVESLWTAHTVHRANVTGFAAPRWYQVNVTGGTVGASTKTFTNTVSKRTYLYRVQAFNASGVSAYSNTITVRVAK